VLRCAAGTTTVHIQEFNTAGGTPAFCSCGPFKHVCCDGARQFLERNTIILGGGARGGAVDGGTALQAGRFRVRFPMVSLEFFIDILLRAVLLSWGRFSL
jgi:hypothetical protein